VTFRLRDMTSLTKSPRVRLPLPALIAVFWVGAGDILRVVGVQGIATVAVAGILVVLSVFLFADRFALSRVGFEPFTEGQRGIPGAWWFFALWVVINIGVVGFAQPGFQNVLLYLIFILTMAYTARFSSEGTGLLLLHWLRRAGVVGALLWLPTVAISGVGTDGALLTRGAAASICVVAMIASIGLVNESRAAKFAPLFFALVIALTLSRLALLAAALLLVATAFAARKRITAKFVTRLLAIVIGVAALVTFYAPLRNRFLENDGSSLGGLEVGTSGRTTIWAELLSKITPENILAGRGAGSAEVTVSNAFIGITQPHSDYLRLLNDFGVVGLVLFVLGLTGLLIATVLRYANAAPQHRPIHLSAVASVLCIVLYAFLDNMIIYIFTMMPFAAIIGVSLSLGSPKKDISGPTKNFAQRNRSSRALS
jgi:O-antigen ligase